MNEDGGSPTAEEREAELKALNAEVLDRFRAFEEKHALVLDDVRLDRFTAHGCGERLVGVDCVFRTKRRF